MVFVKDFKGYDDSERIQNAVDGRGVDGIVIIEPKPDKTPWMLDRAILLPDDTTLIIRSCVLKMTDSSRDNFIRSANCGLGISDPEKCRNIHIIGESGAMLIGADHPRSTGDGGKILACPCPYEVEDLIKYADWIPEERKRSGELLFSERHDHSYGTDALRPDQSHFGDWRNIGILLASVDNFEISGLTLKDYHGWGISLEDCSNGEVSRIRFDARMRKTIDGMSMNIENQDGIDLRAGCRYISISDITGSTGDDVVALTAAKGSKERLGGSLRTTEVLPGGDGRDYSTHDVTIRNVNAKTNLCYIVRLLPINTYIYNVVIDGIIDQEDSATNHGGTFILGEPDGIYGKNLPDSMRNVIISNAICRGKKPIHVAGFLTDSVIANATLKQGRDGTVVVRRENGLKNVSITNTVITE